MGQHRKPCAPVRSGEEAGCPRGAPMGVPSGSGARLPVPGVVAAPEQMAAGAGPRAPGTPGTPCVGHEPPQPFSSSSLGFFPWLLPPGSISTPCTGNRRGALVQGIRFHGREGTASVARPAAALSVF